MTKLNIEKDCQNYHFIGIGGINMSGLAEILHKDGCIVTGSDKNDSDIIAGLRGKGIDAKIGHNAQNLGKDVQVVVYNAAVPADNPEMLAAKARGLRLMGRAELLGRLMTNYDMAICVAGTHGKTTTTSMLAQIFMAAGAEPTVMNGGVLPSMGGAVLIGGRGIIIAEACEYHDSFLQFFPHIGIILNLEMDHSDYFPDIAALRSSFRKFAQKIPQDGLLVVNSGIKELNRLIDGLDCGICIYGESGGLRAERLRLSDAGYPIFDVHSHNGGNLGQVSLQVPGRHNVQNALAAIGTAMHCGIDFDTAAAALSHFSGALRRFQHTGTLNGAQLVDDYAHHPTEVAATLAAARNLLDGKPGRLWAVFQPHTRARTAEFLDRFAAELARADEIIILDIYDPVGRINKNPIHAKDLAAKLPAANCRYLQGFTACADFLRAHAAPNDLIITMGAGDIHKLATTLGRVR